MTEPKLRNLINAIWLSVFALPVAQAARASDAPLIWTPSQTSDTSYAMRMGSRLPMEFEASAGAEVSFSESFATGTRARHPIKFWSSVKLPSPGKKADTDAQLDVRLNGVSGNRSISVRKSRSLELKPGLAARIEDLYSLNYDRGASDRRLDARATKTVRILSRGTGTSLYARGSRSNRDQEWQASVGVEQKVTGSVNLSADADNLAAPRRSSATVRASYAQRW